MSEPQFNFNAPVGQVNTGEMKVDGTNIGTQNNYYGSNPEAAALAKELDELLQPLNADPKNEVAKTLTLQELDKKPSLKERLIAAIKAGGMTAIEELCQHPLAKVALAALKAALFPES